MGNWKRRGNGLVYVFTEDEVSLTVVRQWKRLMKAHNDLAHTVNERKRGTEWATAEWLDKCRTEVANAAANWQAVCRAMGWKQRNGRTMPVHIDPAPTND